MRNIREEILHELQLIIEDLEGFDGELLFLENPYMFGFLDKDGTPYHIISITDDMCLDLSMILPVHLVIKIIKFWSENNE